MNEFLTRAEVAKILNVARSTLIAWVKAGLFPGPDVAGNRSKGFYSDRLFRRWIGEHGIPCRCRGEHTYEGGGGIGVGYSAEGITTGQVRPVSQKHRPIGSNEVRIIGLFQEFGGQGESEDELLARHIG